MNEAWADNVLLRGILALCQDSADGAAALAGLLELVDVQAGEVVHPAGAPVRDVRHRSSPRARARRPR